jgi:8-oxo-dGTP pyrophosphatase MutT (NUDIX family)
MTNNTDWRFNILAGAVTIHDDCFLLLKRCNRESFLPNVWGIPAGRIERGEDPREACLRELLEETGLHGRIVELTGYSYFTSRREHTELNNLQLNFLVDVTQREVRIDHSSHSEYRWVPLDDADDSLLDEFTRSIVDEARLCYKELSDNFIGR